MIKNKRVNFMFTERKHLRLFLILLLLCFVTSNIFAGTTGKISGKVADAKTGEPLIGVNILVVGTTMGSASDIDGNYFIINIPPGNYEVRASLIGYSAVTIQNIRVSVDQTTKIDLSLSEEAVEMNDIVVTAQKPIVQKDLTSTESKVSGDQISMLPLEDIQSVVNLQAGVVDGHLEAEEAMK